MQRWYQDRVTGKLIPADEYHARNQVNKAHFVQPDIEDYVSPVTGLWVSGRKQRRSDLRNTGSRPWEGMEQERKEADRQRTYQEQREDRVLSRIVYEQIMIMPEDRRRKLLRY